MAQTLCPHIYIYTCRNCLPGGEPLLSTWKTEGVQIRVREVPCSGKVDIQYMFHALEGGAAGLCLVACPKGECRLAQGNFRAIVRMKTVKRLLTEIGMEPGKVELLHFSPDGSLEELDKLVKETVERIISLVKRRL
jgi:F420-non-reducing hydrogenase iron-sulfur subunit